MNTKRITVGFVTLFLALLLMVTPVLAGAPQFSKAKASGPDNEGNLTVSYSVAGRIISARTGCTREAIYACKPANGDFPPNPIQQVVTEGFDNVLPSLKHGDILIPPPGASLACDGGMIVALAMVTYSGVNLLGTVDYGFNFIYKSIPGTFSATYYGYTP